MILITLSNSKNILKLIQDHELFLLLTLCNLHFYIPPNLLAPLARAQFLVLSFFLLTICFFSLTLHPISTKLGHKHLWVTGYKSYYMVWPQRSHRGHRGQKRSFQQNCFFSYILHGMIMKFTRMNKLHSLYKTYLIKCQSEVIWGHRVKFRGQISNNVKWQNY